MAGYEYAVVPSARRWEVRGNGRDAPFISCRTEGAAVAYALEAARQRTDLYQEPCWVRMASAPATSNSSADVRQV